MEPLLGEVFDLLALDHAPVANEGDRCGAKSGLDLLELRRKGVWIGGIAGKHVDSDRMPVLVAEWTDDKLALPFFAIAIVAKGGQFVVCTFQVATRDIVQKQGDRLALGALSIESVLDGGLPVGEPIEVFIEGIFIKRV